MNIIHAIKVEALISIHFKKNLNSILNVYFYIFTNFEGLKCHCSELWHCALDSCQGPPVLQAKWSQLHRAFKGQTAETQITLSSQSFITLSFWRYFFFGHISALTCPCLRITDQRNWCQFFENRRTDKQECASLFCTADQCSMVNIWLCWDGFLFTVFSMILTWCSSDNVSLILCPSFFCLFPYTLLPFTCLSHSHSSPLSPAPTAIHSLKLSRTHVDWHSVDEVYLYSDATTSKIARTVTQKLGFSKGLSPIVQIWIEFAVPDWQ